MQGTIQRTVVGLLIFIIIWLVIALVRYHKKYKKLEQARETFLYNISHDLRTPMNVVVGYTELARRNLGDSKRTEEYLEKIDESSKQLLSLIDDIMEMGSMESADSNTTSEEADDKEENLILFGKRVLLVEDNALNSDLGKVILEEEGMQVETAENGTRALEKIRNNPAGYYCFVLMDVHMPIMDGFTATTHIRVMDDKGKAAIPIIAMTATGLAEDKRAALKHGMNGFITKPIDIAVLKSLLLTISNEKCANKPFVAPEAKILLVDDNPMNIRIEKELLLDFHFQVDCAVNGAEAIEMLKNVRYDLVFMDYMMPVMDGVEATKTIRAMDDPYYQALPIIALSANAILDAQKKFKQAGMNDFLSKPIQMSEVSKVLRRWLPKHYIKEVNTINPQEQRETPIHKLTIPGIDVQAGITNCMNEKLFRKMLRDFHGLIEEKSNRIERFLEERDIRNFTIEVHAMKSSARMVGALELSEKFKTLEDLGITENVSLISQLAPGILETFRKYRESLKPYVETEPVVQKELPKEEILAMLERLEKAMDEFDLDTADETMKELETVIFDEETRAQIERLKVYLLDVAIEDVLRLTAALIKKMKEE